MDQIIFMDSCGDPCEQSTTGYANHITRYDSRNQSSGNWIGNLIEGRGGGNAYNCRGNGYLRKQINEIKKVHVGFAFKRHDEEIISSGGISILSLRKISNLIILAIGNLDGNGTKFLLYAGETLVAQGQKNIPTQTWIYVTACCEINKTDGRFILYINGKKDIDFTGDTDRFDLESFSELGLGYSSLLSTGNLQRRRYYDDIYIREVDDVETEIKGDVRVIARHPSQDYDTEFTPHVEGNNYGNIDSQPQENKYVRGELFQQDLYRIQNIQDTSGYIPTEVHAIQPVIYAMSEGESIPIKSIIQSSDSSNYGQAQYPDANGEQKYFVYNCVNVDPGTGQKWTLAKANNIIAGFKLEGDE